MDLIVKWSIFCHTLAKVGTRQIATKVPNIERHGSPSRGSHADTCGQTERRKDRLIHYEANRRLMCLLPYIFKYHWKNLTNALNLTTNNCCQAVQFRCKTIHFSFLVMQSLMEIIEGCNDQPGCKIRKFSCDDKRCQSVLWELKWFWVFQLPSLRLCRLFGVLPWLRCLVMLIKLCVCIYMYIYIYIYIYKVVQIWPGTTVTSLHTISPGHIWTTL
jgi:hypothetical protein